MINSDRIEEFVEQVMGHALLAEAFDEEPDRVIDSFIADASPDDIRTVIVEYARVVRRDSSPKGRSRGRSHQPASRDGSAV